MFSPNEIVEVAVARGGGNGYLAANAGDTVEVLHFEADPDPDLAWVYARFAQHIDRHGWIDVKALIPPGGKAPLQSGATVCVTEKVTNPASSGYLSADVGQRFEVLHVGSGDADTGWLYARAEATAGGEPVEGWLQAGAVQCTAPLKDKPLPAAPEKKPSCPSADAPTCAIPPPTSLAGPVETLPSLASLTTAPRPSRPCPVPTRPCPVPDDFKQEASSPSRQSELRGRARSLPPAPCEAPPPPPAAETSPPQRRRGNGRDFLQQAPQASNSPSSPSASSSGTLRLLTFGLETCDSELVNLCKDSSGPTGGAGAWLQVDDDTLRRALRRLGEPRVDLVLDARHFPDPNAAKHITRHTGIHPQIIERIVNHKYFKWYLEEVHKKWRHCESTREPGSPNDMVVAVYCKSGKHRSVAVAECLKRIGEREEGLRCHDVKHLSKANWGKNMCRGACEECRGIQPDRERALEVACEVWRSADAWHLKSSSWNRR